jgi:hypothetical protein
MNTLSIFGNVLWNKNGSTATKQRMLFQSTWAGSRLRVEVTPGEFPATRLSLHGEGDVFPGQREGFVERLVDADFAESDQRRTGGLLLAGVSYRVEVVTAAEVYELTTRGGATDFARLIEACESVGPYCLIGGLAVNCFVEPVYTLDADIVVIATGLSTVSDALAPGSDLRIQFSTDERYQPFLARSVEGPVLGIRVRIACLEDVTCGKLWAYSDPRRRLSKRKKDELDLIRLAEAYPKLRSLYPGELLELLDRG